MIRLLLAAAIAMASSLAGTRVLIWWLTRLQIGQPIRDDGPRGHATKAGTPTMGGLAIVGGALLGYILSDLYRGIYTRSGIFVMLAIIGGGAVGLMDDWIKVVRERSLGSGDHEHAFAWRPGRCLRSGLLRGEMGGRGRPLRAHRPT